MRSPSPTRSWGGEADGAQEARPSHEGVRYEEETVTGELREERIEAEGDLETRDRRRHDR